MCFPTVWACLEESDLMPAVLESRRAKKRKKWPNESMLAALEAVKNGCPVKRAAMEQWRI